MNNSRCLPETRETVVRRFTPRRPGWGDEADRLLFGFTSFCIGLLHRLTPPMTRLGTESDYWKRVRRKELKE